VEHWKIQINMQQNFCIAESITELRSCENIMFYSSLLVLFSICMDGE